MNPHLSKPSVSCILIVALTSLVLSLSIQAAPQKHWNELEKIPKPSHKGIHEEFKDSFVYLSYGNRSTCIPKSSLLSLPDSLASRVTAEPLHQVVVWSEFIRSNYSWVRSYSVSWDQATGKQELSESQFASFSDFNVLMVATYLNNPISFRRLKKEGETLTKL